MRQWFVGMLVLGALLSVTFTYSMAQEPTVANEQLLKLQTLISDEYQRLRTDRLLPNAQPLPQTAETQFTVILASLHKLQALMSDEYKRLLADQVIPNYERLDPALPEDQAQLTMMMTYLRIRNTQWMKVTNQSQQDQLLGVITQEQSRKLQLTIQQLQQELETLKQGQKASAALAAGSAEPKPQ